VLCPDCRGRGRSAYDNDWHRYQPHAHVEDIRHLLAVPDVRGVIATGPSLGGALTMIIAITMPTAVAEALLNDLGPRVESAILQQIIDCILDDRPQLDWTAAACHLC